MSRNYKSYILDFLESMALDDYVEPNFESADFSKIVADVGELTMNEPVVELMGPPDDYVEPNFESADFSKIVADVGELTMNEPIVALFARAGLNYRRPDAWLTLVGFIAEVLLIEGNSGRRAQWKRPSKNVLSQDLDSCLQDNHRLNGKQTVENMKRKFPRKYENIPASTILRWIGDSEISIRKAKDKVKGVTRAKES
jgi:hypothetical protein